MKRVLITGGAGFLGSHLCDRFLAEGYAVICMDNLITGSKDNIEHLFGREEFLFMHQDVTEFIHVPGRLGRPGRPGPGRPGRPGRPGGPSRPLSPRLFWSPRPSRLPQLPGASLT